MTDEEKKALREELLGAVKTTVGELLKPVVEAQNTIASTMAADKEAAKVAAAAGDASKKDGADGAGKPLSAEEIDKRINDRAAALLDERFKAQQTSAEAKARRDAFVGEKMKDLPDVYRAKLGSDPEKWASEEQDIRNQAKADAAAMGFVAKDVGGAGGGAGQGAGAGGGVGGVANNFNGALTDGQAKYAAGIKLPGKAE